MITNTKYSLPAFFIVVLGALCMAVASKRNEWTSVTCVVTKGANDIRMSGDSYSGPSYLVGEGFISIDGKNYYSFDEVRAAMAKRPEVVKEGLCWSFPFPYGSSVRPTYMTIPDSLPLSTRNLK